MDSGWEEDEMEEECIKSQLPDNENERTWKESLEIYGQWIRRRGGAGGKEDGSYPKFPLATLLLPTAISFTPAWGRPEGW